MNPAIRVYWHLWLVNHWAKVVEEQLTVLRQGGMMDAAETILVSVCGGQEEQRELARMLPARFQVVTTTTNPKRYEFPALEVLYVDALVRPPFVALYFHGKGVSYADDKAKRWRHILNEGVLRRWRDHYSAIVDGCDVAGQNYLRGKAPHFSGNFWLASSRYLAQLRNPMTLRQSNRYAAEMWLCSRAHRPFKTPFIEPNPKRLGTETILGS